MNQMNRIVKILTTLDSDMFPEASGCLGSVVEGDADHMKPSGT